MEQDDNPDDINDEIDDDSDILSNNLDDDIENIDDEIPQENDDDDDDDDDENKIKNDDDDDDDDENKNKDNETDDDDDDDTNQEQDEDEDDKFNKDSNIIKSDIYKSTFIANEDLENNDSVEFLQKFDTEQKKDYIINSHQECLSKNYNEIKKLAQVIRNKENVIIDELHKTLPILTKYETTRILGIRIKQLNNNSKPYINVSENIMDNFLIANLELKEKKLPFIIERPLPNNTFEYWKLQDLEIL